MNDRSGKPQAQAQPQPASAPEPDVTFPDPNAVPVQETPEFKQAVAEATAAAVKDAMASLAAATMPAAGGGDMRSFAEQMAMAIASISNQGTGTRAPVPPEEMHRRAQARKLMDSLLRDARRMAAMGDADAVPLYELRNKIYIGDFVTDPIWTDSAKKLQNTTIRWPHVPNEVMIPVNETAKLIHEAFLDSIGRSSPNLAPETDVHMSSTGFVVNGRAPSGRAAGMVPSRSDTGLEIVRDQSRVPGENRLVRVLGTIQAPASQPV